MRCGRTTKKRVARAKRAWAARVSAVRPQASAVSGTICASWNSWTAVPEKETARTTSTAPVARKSVFSGSLASSFRSRTDATARAAMPAASPSARDPFVKLLLRQIGTDSLRHADIVSELIASSGRSGGSGAAATAEESRVLVSSVLEQEERATDASVQGVIVSGHPAILALLASTDYDEEKHKRLLKLALKKKMG